MKNVRKSERLKVEGFPARKFYERLGGGLLTFKADGGDGTSGTAVLAKLKGGSYDEAVAVYQGGSKKSHFDRAATITELDIEIAKLIFAGKINEAKKLADNPTN
jgi:hypothetical protein